MNTMTNRTYTTKPKDITRKWYLIDAKDQILGRLSVKAANILRGKEKPIFSPHLDCGDFVVVINAEQIKLTGDKLNQKIYYRHSGHVGGLKSKSAKEILAKHPPRLIFEAVKGMLPQNNLSRRIIKKLKVHCGASHPHEAQSPTLLEIS